MTAERPSQPIIGEAPVFLEMLEHVSRAAPLSKPVLVVGERGTGKELVASRLHYLSDRWESSVVKVNCAALTETILESELFGHEAGAFTGAVKTHVGHFERADGGTLILDELATISLRMQEKILRVIEYGEIQRVGSSKIRRVNVRVLSATNANLAETVAAGEPSTRVTEPRTSTCSTLATSPSVDVPAMPLTGIDRRPSTPSTPSSDTRRIVVTVLPSSSA